MTATAVELLGEVGYEAAIPRLLEFLKFKYGRVYGEWDNHEMDVAVAAVKALAKFGKSIVPTFAKALKDGTDVDMEIVEALKKMGKPAVPALIQAVKFGSPWDVPGRAVEILGEIGDEAAVLTLVKALKDDNPSTRKKAAKAIGKIGDKRAVEPLKKALEDLNVDVRKAAKVALKSIQKK